MGGLESPMGGEAGGLENPMGGVVAEKPPGARGVALLRAGDPGRTKDLEMPQVVETGGGGVHAAGAEVPLVSVPEPGQKLAASAADVQGGATGR